MPKRDGKKGEGESSSAVEPEQRSLEAGEEEESVSLR
jgi:hypothetical protein